MIKNKNIPQVRFNGFDGEWKTNKVDNICLISTGKSNTQDRVADGLYPFYVRSPIVEMSKRYLFEEEAVLTVGDGVGTGKVHHYVNGKYDLHQRVYRMFNFNKVLGKFFYYYFTQNFYSRVMSMTAKSSVDSVRMEMIADMSIVYPSIEEQKHIALSLDQLDQLITQKQKKHTKLLHLKKAMLHKMFPQNGATTPEIRFKGFEGEWEEKSFKDNLISIQTGTNLLGSVANNGTPLLKMGNIQRGFFSIEKIEYLNTKNTIEKENIAFYGDFFFNPTWKL
ncbi:hypothetical protein DMA11_04350 [Marinilabiliaceae bacterium JC017]|nr:hypothetical protein DMA11_04350 [Marinilabiliaceae bacterium JC017]